MSKPEWTPSQGEVVWIKVFSNWSKGTYIGYDVIKNQHLVRESEEGGGHLLISADVLPEHANPNESKIDKKQNSVEWLVQQIWKNEPLEHEQKVIEQAKAMHRKEIIDAHWNGVEFPQGVHILDDSIDYYNETFGGNNE